jgi:ADP-heptose:LPS heptosyltransferase
MGVTYSFRKRVFSRLVELLATPLCPLLCRRPTELPKRIILIEPFQMGDILSLSVMLDPLKENYPDAEIYLLTQSKNKHVYDQDPRVKGTLTGEFFWVTESRGFARLKSMIRTAGFLWGLRERGWDIGIDTRGEIRSQLALVLMGCKQRIGSVRYLNSNIILKGWLLTGHVEQPFSGHRYDYNLTLLRGLNLAVGEAHFPSYKRDGVFPERVVEEGVQVVVHPGARWVYKQWPKDRWISLLNRLGKQMGVYPIMIAGPGEEELVSEITSGLTVPHKMKMTSFDELVGLLKGADLFVGLDSGPMNLASVLGVPSVALFGPGDFEQWHPYVKGSVGIFHKFPCNPCLQKKCFFKKKNCMASISTEEVYAAIQEILLARVTQQGEEQMESRPASNNNRGLKKIHEN